MCTLLNRLLNENYTGKKIKFINLDFNTNETYELYPILKTNTFHYYGGHLKYYGSFDRKEFCKLDRYHQFKFVWGTSFNWLQECAVGLKNESLSQAVNLAYLKGLEMDLCTDYRIVESNISVQNEQMKASIWILFEEDGMCAKLILENSRGVVYQKIIDKAGKGIEFFLEIYKAISVEGTNIIIKGRKDVEGLPMVVPISEIKPRT